MLSRYSIRRIALVMFALAFVFAVLGLSASPLGAGTSLASVSASEPTGYPPTPTHLAALPAVGGITATIRVHYIADDVMAGGGDVVEVKGPEGTRCASDSLIYDSVDGPGPVTLYFGPNAYAEYPVLAGTAAFVPGDFDDKLLARWCPGTYQGQIWLDGSYTPFLVDIFTFRISASKHAPPPPAPTVARHLRHVTVTPRRGAGKTVFAVRFRADASDLETRGDVIDLQGPRHSACRGNVGEWVPQTSAGPVTLHIGPGADHNVRWEQNGSADPPTLSRWCPGTYRGTIRFEKFAKFTLVTRFTIAVAGRR